MRQQMTEFNKVASQNERFAVTRKRKISTLVLAGYCILTAMLFSVAHAQSPLDGVSDASTSVSFEADVAAADRGDIQAELRVAKAYSRRNSKPNYAEAYKWFESASRQGSKEATAWLGSMYLYGQGVSQDLNQAATLIKSSAESDDPVGLRFLGLMYETGHGTARDYPRAVEAFAKAVKLNDPESCRRMGTLFLRGLGVKKDLTRAMGLFIKGGRLGDSWSQLNLGEMYESGNYIIPTVNSKTGSALPTVQNPSTNPLNAGSTGANSAPPSRPNLIRARQLFALSAARGNRVAAFKLGEMYETGRGATKNYTRAINFYRQSAAQQYAPAQLALGRATEFGLGTPINLTYAYLWYSLASEQENVVAGERLRLLSQKLTPDQRQEAQMWLSKLEEKRTGN